MTAALVFVAILLTIGLVCRVRVGLFRVLYIPASVIAGLLGLAMLQTARAAGPAPSGPEPWLDWSAISSELASWPGWLIAVVFAALLLEKESQGWGRSLGRVSREVVMVWIIVLGQTAIGLLVTWLVVQRFYDVPNSFGMLIETGFAGGHGTAAAMGVVFAHPTIQLDGGLALGTLMATTGLVYGVVSGILWINIGVRAGWIGSAATASQATAVSDAPREPIGYQVVDREVIDSLLLQMVWLALAIGIGLLLQFLAGLLGTEIDSLRATSEAASAGADAALRERMRASAIVGSFPLFIYTLFGGWAVRRVLTMLGLRDWIDGGTIQRLSAVAMDILVVAAIASLNLHAVAQLIVPFSALLVAGCIWTAFCLLWLSRRVLPREHWFQLGLINYGMSTGTTATGFVLLRIVDPDVRTGAAEDYAIAAPFSAPFIGGGMMTIALPLLVLERVPIAASALALSTVVIVLIVLGIRMGNRDQAVG